MKNNNHPLVSIIIPVYNGSNYIREAIDSAIQQTYDNKEIIVVNDGSNDNGATENIILSYGSAIQYIYKKNGGVSSALNEGIRNMHGKYFSWLSHDDMYLPQKIETQVKVLETFTETNIIAVCGSKMIDENSNDLRGSGYWEKQKPDVLIPWDKALSDVMSYSISGCALLIPRKVFEEIGMFDEELRYSQDYFMWINIFLKKYYLIRTSGTHVCIRVHGKQLSKIGSAIFYQDSLKIGEALQKPLLQISTKENNIYKTYVIRNAKYNNYELVNTYIQAGKENGLLSFKDIIIIKTIAIYGKIRPIIRKYYYKIFRGIDVS